jgi:hypothetical protein
VETLQVKSREIREIRDQRSGSEPVSERVNWSTARKILVSDSGNEDARSPGRKQNDP